MLVRRRFLVAGGCGVMLAGLLLTLWPGAFLAGLALFASGTGLVKGNLSAQVGVLFDDEAARRKGYGTYLGFLNGGVICGPLVCGTLAAGFGWSAAMGGAAAGVAAALACCLVGRNGAARPASVIAPTVHSVPRSATPRHTLLLLGVLAAAYLCYAAYEQMTGPFLLWARGAVALRVGGWPLPVAWFLSLDGLFTLALLAAWRLGAPWLDRRGIRVDAAGQILAGCLLCAAGQLVLAAVAAASPLVATAGALLYLLLIDAAIVLVWPAGLSLMAGVAPGRRVGWWTGLFYLHGFFASLWVGFSGALFPRMAAAPFWTVQAAVAGLGALLAIVLVVPLARGFAMLRR